VLVLRRRAGETIAIGGGIEIEVIEISRTRVKLGVTAPREVSVLRKETISVAAENRKALEFISRGPESMTETLRLLGKDFIPASGLELKAALPICVAEDIPGIPNESEEPGPGMMTGTYHVKDAKNAINSN
jgi:carbon storage regulator